jgi:site-specific recombinase XerD
LWRKFENHLIKEGNSQNTILKRFKTLKVFIYRAIEQGIIKENPLKKIKIKSVEGQMLYLTIEEVNKLEKLFKGFLTNNLHKTLHYFLFACYTGLRYSDIKNLKFSNIYQDQEGKYIQKQVFKTKDFIKIPLSKRAIELIPSKSFNEKCVFDVYSNQETNRNLKDLMKLAGINKRITFHCARHTFATITLELDGDLSAVQKLCGHSKIQTTQIYAKVLDKSKQRAIDRWNTI